MFYWTELRMFWKQTWHLLSWSFKMSSACGHRSAIHCGRVDVSRFTRHFMHRIIIIIIIIIII
jgi:hypothetical protein